MKFTFRIATENDDNLINNEAGVTFPANMSQDNKDLLIACNKLKADSVSREETIILILDSGTKRSQMKKILQDRSKYITGGVLRLEDRGKETLIIRKVSVPAKESEATPTAA